jgi:recombination protein RecR
MMDTTLARLISALRCLPGVGPKSAQRMAYHLLNKHRERGLLLADSLYDAMTNIHHCERCNNLTTQSVCHICANPDRDKDVLCIVESPSDMLAIEQSQAFNGYYYILMGKISPLDGIGPEQIGLPRLHDRILTGSFQELIIALSPSVEGQTTSYFIHELIKNQSIKITQLAHGIPSSAELEYLDCNTIGSALRNRLALAT